MKILHLSDVLLGNPNYRRDVQTANEHDLIDLDRQAAFIRAVECARHHAVDVFLVAGGLIDERSGCHIYRSWLNTQFQNLIDAEITPLIYAPDDDITGVNAELLNTKTSRITVADTTFSTLNSDANATIIIGHGRIDGAGSNATFNRTIDDRRIAKRQENCGYIALGGMLETQPVHANAWYSGSLCGVFAYHTGTPGALLVELGADSGRLLNLTHIALPSRRRESITIDAGGLSKELLADILQQRIDEACWSVDPHTPLSEDDPLTQLYGQPSGANGVGWWSRPIITINVFGARHHLKDVLRTRPILEHMLLGAEHLLALVKWELQDNERPITHRFVPHRSRAMH